MSDPTQPVGEIETTKNEAAATPAPVAATTEVKAADAAAPVAKAEKAPKAPKEPKAPRVQLPKQFGVTRPGGGQTGKVWEVADRISAETGAPALRKAVIEECTAANVNPATIATQYGRWRKFNGLGKEAKAAAATEAPAAVAAPADATVEAPKS